MKKNYMIILALGFCFCLLLTVSGCVIHIGDWPGDRPRAKYEKTIKAQAPLESGSILVANTSYGSITVSGADTTDCSVLATIRVQAPSEEEAAEIAEKVKIELELAGKTLTVRADKPHLKKKRSISISYQITVPAQTNIECTNSYGSIECKNINGQIQADTSYGGVNCREIISGELNVSSSYGNIDIEYSDLSPAEIQADVSNSYGSIDFTTPPGFTGQVELSTSYGSVKTDLPITIQGRISNQRIKGTIGEGNGKLILKTSYGSIGIR
ncbi:MAG: DUF4097 family beta strand repeat-containing protein [Planctomycetota bacterium]|jgi:hypothetical protein